MNRSLRPVDPLRPPAPGLPALSDLKIQVRWLGLLDAGDQALLLDAAALRPYKRGDTILSAGEVPDVLYVLLSGQAHVMFEDAQRRRNLLSAIARSGETFGEASLVGATTSVSAVRAATDCEVLCIDRGHFLTVLLRNNALMYHFMRHFVARLRLATEQIRRMATLDVAERVACALFDLAEPHREGGALLRARLPRGQLALQVGATRQRVGRVLRAFESSGWMSRTPHGHYVLSADLRRFAGLDLLDEMGGLEGPDGQGAIH
jgi:CRP/FNR family cyclic AMP-dependent transcriptional regulator